MTAPAPWETKRWSSRESGIKDAKGNDVCGWTNNENAPLISAAPQLLSASEEAYAFLYGVEGSEQVRAQLRVAILKAKEPVK